MSLDTDISLVLSLVFIVGGLIALTWSADVFIDGAGAIARRFGVSPLIVGMVIIGFGTSAPELAVSVLSGLGGHSNLSLGNAYGSSIFNIAAILGLTALIRPISVKPSVSLIAVPVLTGIALLSWLLIRDGAFGRGDGLILLAVFAVLMPAYCLYDQKTSGKCATGETRDGGCSLPDNPGEKPALAWLKLFAGLAILIASSHVLVWGCVDFTRDILKVSDLMIGLTIVAVGTSLPELASAVASARRGQHEFIIGNIVGSNLFNMLAVVGVAGTLSPFCGFSTYISVRDLPVTAALTLSIALFGLNFRHPGRPGTVTAWEGAIWLLTFTAYLSVMIMQEAM